MNLKISLFKNKQVAVLENEFEKSVHGVSIQLEHWIAHRVCFEILGAPVKLSVAAIIRNDLDKVKCYPINEI